MEGGAGAAVNASGYAYFTTDLVSNRSYGSGLAAGQLVSYRIVNIQIIGMA